MQLGMFGTVSACRHVLGDRHGTWVAAMCGVCLAIRDRAGQVARATVSTDAIATAVLTADLATAAGGDPVQERHAGPCPARGMRRAHVWTGAPATLGAGVSLLAATVAVRDKMDDGELSPVWHRPARRWADRIGREAAHALTEAGIDVDRIDRSVASSRAAEQARSASIADWTGPVADAYGSVFAPLDLAPVGRRVGRITLLADAIEDLDDDAMCGRSNPILTGACTTGEARAIINHDVRAIGAAVAAAAPDSLAALLWGPGLERGVRSRIRQRCSTGCATKFTAAPDEGGPPTTDDSVWPARADDSTTQQDDDETSRRRDQRQDRGCSWTDCCDPCACCDCDCCECCCPCDC